MKNILFFFNLFLAFNLSAQTNNYSLEFDGSDDYVLVGNHHSFGMGSWTINFWIKPENLQNANQQNIMSKSWQGGYKVDFMPNSDSLRFWLKSPSSASVFEVHSPQLTEDIWTFISLEIDRTNNLSKLFVNGSLVDTENITSLGDLSNATNLNFGCNYWFDSSNIAEFFEGKLDQISFWNYAMDTVLIQQYMNCPPLGNEVGLVGYWDFEEGTGTTTADQTVNANSGTLMSGVAWSTDLPANNCMNSIIEIDNASISIFPNPTNELINIDLGDLSRGKIIIYDMLGNEILSHNYTSNKVQLNIKNLGTKGTYFISILDTDEQTIATTKFIYQ